MIQVTITANEQNKRLDNFVKKYLKNAPLSFIYKLFRKEDIKVNGKHQKADYITKLNDVVSIYISDEQAKEFIQDVDVKTSKRRDFTVIYEDENVLIVNKKDGLLVNESYKDSNEETLTKQVLSYLIEKGDYDAENEKTFVPALAHRIDRNTSGIVVIGKTLAALQELFEAFKDHGGIDKEYNALVAGKIFEGGIIEAPLIKDSNKNLVNVDFKNGLSAISEYKPLHIYEDVTLVSVKILTGRTHQIRVHMNYINHPLVGDSKYGNNESDRLAQKYNMKRYILHAKSICFHNLGTNLSYLNDKVFTAPLMEWQQEIIKRIGK